MLNVYSKVFFILEILYIQLILSFPLESDSPSTYDQRQTGKYNIHISLKDVAIIEVDKNEFIDDTDNNAGDYYYDEEDLTIKPISNWLISTTKKTTPTFNTTSKGLIDVHLLPNEKEIADTDVLQVMEPVLHNNKKTTQANIPQVQTAQRNLDHTGVIIKNLGDSPSTYDQRQTGKYNIHISLKDVAIIEVDKNEFIDDTDNNAGDYYYDEEDLTIKPISNWLISTTKKTTPTFNTTSKGLIDVHLLPNEKEIADTDVLQVMEPVLHNNKKTTQANIPQVQTAQRNLDHTGVTLTVHNAKKIRKGNQFSSTIPNIISEQSQFSICKNNGADVSGNCRKKMRSPILKSLFDILKLIRLKDI